MPLYTTPRIKDILMMQYRLLNVTLETDKRFGINVWDNSGFNLNPGSLAVWKVWEVESY